MAGKRRISIVIPAYNEAECLGKLHDELRAVCDPLPNTFEFIFVNDGSTDETQAVLARLRGKDERVRYLELSRNFGHQAALSAGLAFAGGDAVIMMDGDLQHPPSLIPRLLECWHNGFDVVNTVRVETENSSPGKELFSRAFYPVFAALTGLRLEPGTADFRLMAREPVEAFNQLPERHRFIRGLVGWLGFRQTSVAFRAPGRWAGRPKYTFGRSLRLALEGITAFNPYPLRSAAIFGMIVIFASLVFGLLALSWQLAGGGPLVGWSSLFCCVLFLGGCQLAALGIISEYLGRTLDQVTGRPLYIIRSASGFAVSSDSARGAIPPHHLNRSVPRPAEVRTPPEPKPIEFDGN
jgi:polyisoprenyl-phosphate glycosyltransferase